MDYYNLAIKRESTRSFKKKTISEKQLTELLEYFPICRKLVQDLTCSIKILDSGTYSLLSGCAGYHNFMIEAPHYILITSPKKDYYLENAGYMGEDLALKLTELELESCWITVGDSEEVKKRLNLPEDREPCALIAFGNAVATLPSSRLDIKSVSDVNIKKRTGFVAPKLSVDHAVYTKTWGESAEISSLPLNSSLYQAFIAACCAPSYLNLQSYRFMMDSDMILLITLPDDMTTPGDTCLNAGIAMLHFAGTMENHRHSETGWIPGAPDRAYSLPEGAVISGYYKT